MAQISADRQGLHDLIERLPSAELPAARRFLEFLSADPVSRSLLLAAPDDEPLTESDIAAIRQAERDAAASRVRPHDEVLREFGIK